MGTPLKIRIAQILFVFQIGLFASAYSQNNGSDFESIVKSITEAAQLDRTSAIELLDALFEFKDELGMKLGQIADPTIPFARRQQISRETIAKFFISETVPVQVSSKYRTTISTKPVKDYFDALMWLNRTKSYITVELYFSNFWGFVGIKQLDNRRYEVATAVWQIFRGVRDDGSIYSDATRKKIRSIVEKDGGGKWIIKATEIAVSETRSLEKYLRDERNQ